MTPGARLAAAIDLLAAIDAAPRKPADAVANEFFRNRRYIGSGDRRGVSDRVWRLLRARRRLAWWAERAGLPGGARSLVATSLLIEGWSVAGVMQSFSGGQYAPDGLNAAERAALARLEGHTLDHPDMPDSVRLEVPDWLLPLLRARFGARTEPELLALTYPAPLDLRVNLLKATREVAQAALADEGIDCEPTRFSPWGLRVDGRPPLGTGNAFRGGLVEIQDEGSQVVAGLVGAVAGMRVLDACAGAGGKTLAMAMTMDNRGHIVACDTSALRLDSSVLRLRRAGVHNVERHVLGVGDKWTKRRAGAFDRVLVDAPCTGSGTWRRNPDARLRLRPSDLDQLVEKQAAILGRMAGLVRPGGRLVYATCSLLEEENEAQVQHFVAAHPEFRVLPLAQAWPLPGAAPATGDFLNLTPREHGTDGFFAAVLERVG